MIKEGKIGVQEAIFLIVITITVKAYFSSATFLAKAVGTASWYTTLISSATAILGFTAIYFLLKRFPGKDLIQVFELSLGRVMGFIFSMVLAVSLFIDAALILREFSEILKIYTMPLTPPSFVIGTFSIVMCGVCFMGLECLVRFSRLFGYFLLIGFLAVIILAWNNYDHHSLFPIMGYGLTKTISYGVSRSSFYGEVIILGVIAASLQGTAHLKKVGYISLIISGIITSSVLFFSLMAFNYSIAQEVASQMYSLTRTIRIGGFLQRLDPLFIFTWGIGTLISVTALFYAFLSIYSKIFRIQDMRPLIVPSAIILFTVAMIPSDFITVTQYVHVLRQNGWIVFYGLPLVALIVATTRKKKGTGKSA